MTNKRNLEPSGNFSAYYHSPIGTIEIAGTETGITGLAFARAKKVKTSPVPSCLKDAVQQIDEYFQGKRKKFSLNLILKGTEFQKKVWRELLKIPSGRTASYKDIAVAIGREKAVRAVGNANRLNKISIIIPCHRVIGSNGTLVGYGGGLWRKKWLLEHEQKL
jgi:methylated-DNA-[protein]-cysteine S-methyltransferase